MNYGKNIERARKKANMTQEAVAERIGVSRVMISRIENNTRDPSVKLLVAIAKLFGCTVDELIADKSA